MFDPLSLATGAALLAIGYLSGRIVRPKTTTPAPALAMCGCKHNLSQHDPISRSCHADIQHARFSTYTPCTCRQYIGPIPAEQYMQTQILPPMDS